jgi:CheY-like chemotaxis protein
MTASTTVAAEVLVVEDERLAREALKALLERQGYHVAAAANGREALNFLRTHQLPAVILLDLMMPVMNGWEFRKEQRRDPALASVPVVICSGAGDVRAEADLIAAVGCLQKPVGPEQLADIVGHYCALRRN